MPDKSPDALVFTAPEGGPLRAENFRRRVWLPALEAGGLPAKLGIHGLRHTCAALLIANGAQPKEVQTHLRHSTISVTFDHYGHLFEQKLDEMAAGLDKTFRESRAHQSPTTSDKKVIPFPTPKEETGS